MCVFLLFMMVERQVLRGRALANVYGWKTMAFSILLPPLFPLRLLWGNLINMCATFRAWRQKIAYVLLRGREAKAAAAPVVEHRGNAAEEEAKESLQRTETTRKPRMRRLRRKVPHGTRPTTNFSPLRCSNAIGAFWATRCWRGVSWSQGIWKTPWDRRVRAACGWGGSC